MVFGSMHAHLMPIRTESLDLLTQYVESDNLRHHCRMAAAAVEAYAQDLGKPEADVDRWWTAGLLHDLDWEAYPDEHPLRATSEILPEAGYDDEVINAIRAHAPERTGREPETKLERYLFACDELSGFMHAVALVRPNGFDDMKVRSVKKKLKDGSFAANVPREDIRKGAELIDKPLNEHIAFLIEVFKKNP